MRQRRRAAVGEGTAVGSERHIHIRHVYEEGELAEERTIKDFLIVRQEGGRRVQRNVEHYNLDGIISIGFRVKSHRGTQFRIWATQRLHEYLLKGFALDDERLKRGMPVDFRAAVNFAAQQAFALLGCYVCAPNAPHRPEVLHETRPRAGADLCASADRRYPH